MPLPSLWRAQTGGRVMTPVQARHKIMRNRVFGFDVFKSLSLV